MSSQVTIEANARFAGLSSRVANPMVLGPEFFSAAAFFLRFDQSSAPVAHSDFFATIGNA